MISATPDPIRTRWSDAVGEDAGPGYAQRIAAAQDAARRRGEDPHGEARFVHDLLGGEGRVLDAGCGTGRVALALHDLGHPVVGVDADLSMLRQASDAEPKIPFWLSDLSDLDVPQGIIGAGFDAVVLAGNVVPYLAEGTLAATMGQLAGVTRRGGHVVAGFGIHPDDLPRGLPVTSLSSYDEACDAAGLVPVDRFAGWAREPFEASSHYVVRVHRRPAAEERAGRRGLGGLFRRS